MCGMCMHSSVRMAEYEEVSGTLLDHPPSYCLEEGLLAVTRVILPSLPHSSRVIGICGHTQLFTEVLRSQTQVFMSAL